MLEREQISRRKLFKIGAGAAVAALTLRSPEYLGTPDLHELYNRRAESFGHNIYLKEDPFTLGYPVDNYEIDVIEIEEELLVAHTESEARSMTLDEREYRNLPTYLLACQQLGVPPHIDIKNNPNNPDRLIDTLHGALQQFSRVTVSSKKHDFLDRLKDSHFTEEKPEGRILYTFDKSERGSLLDFIDQEHDNENERRVGASLHYSLVSPATIKAMHDRGLYALSWTVNRPDAFIQSLVCEVNGITSDEFDLFEQMGKNLAA